MTSYITNLIFSQFFTTQILTSYIYKLIINYILICNFISLDYLLFLIYMSIKKVFLLLKDKFII